MTQYLVALAQPSSSGSGPPSGVRGLLIPMLLVFGIGYLVIYLLRRAKERRTKLESGPLSPKSPPGRKVVHSETANLAKAVTFTHADSNVPSIVFEKDIYFSQRPAPRHDQPSAFSCILPQVMTDLLLAQGVRGTFRATVNPMTLMRYANGSVSSILTGSGGDILSHAGFTQVNAAAVFAPLLVYQVLSVVTGQYYLHGIASQLSDIAAKLDILINYHHNESASKLKVYSETMKDVLGRKTIVAEDAVAVQAMQLEASVIEREYTELLLRIDEGQYSKSMTKGFFSSVPKLHELEKYLDHDMPGVYATMALLARRTRALAQLTELKVNMVLSQQDGSRVERSRAIVDKMLAFRPEDCLHDEVLHKSEAILGTASRVAKDIREEADRQSSKSHAEGISNSALKTLKEIAELNDANWSLIEDIRQRMQASSELLLVADDAGVRLLSRTEDPSERG